MPKLKDGGFVEDTHDRRSIASIELRKPTKEELRSCRCCRIFCLIMFFAILIALLAMSIYLIITRNCNNSSQNSVKGSIVYTIDVKTFADSNNDSFGDIQGLKLKLDYFRSFSVTTLVLNDVVSDQDFGTIPKLGSATDFQDFFDELKRQGMQAVISFNPCAVSSESDWFKQVFNKSSGKEDWFIVKHSNETNNWKNKGGTSAWYAINNSSLTYYSYFGRESPMLNYHNSNVKNVLIKQLKYWKKLGASGFLLNHVSRLMVDQKLRSNNDSIQFDQDQPSTHDLLKQIYIDVKKASGMVWLAPTSNIKSYFNAENPEADLLLTDVVARLVPPINVTTLNHTIASLLTSFPEFGKIGWINGGLEYKTIATRFSSESARLMVLFSLVLPSTVLFYNKEENLIKNQSHYQSDDEFSRLCKLRVLRREFQTLPTSLSCSNSTLEIIYEKNLLVAINFGDVPSNVTYNSKVLYDSSNRFENRLQREKTESLFIKPFNLIVAEIL